MMNDKKERITRKSSTPIKVYCLPEEKEQIEAQAKRAGMSAARYLREVGQGYHISGVVDYEQVRELARINGDLGRLGGLLKLWLTDDVRTAQFGQSTILAVLGRIEATQEEMGKVMTKIVMPRSEP
uniref:conjugal transfer transcriptional regulator TraJ n=1 Tax=Gilvimarinus agarilyticus TaxID=679259 RepID=UPI0018DBA7B2|nr:conjugal transfer transcriptional regulator TraJ [Gilvimarinus agarilyticus]